MNPSDYTFNPVLARASTIPARWYTDPAMLEGERRSVFGRTWQAVGRTDSVAAPGSSRPGWPPARFLERLPPPRLASGRRAWTRRRHPLSVSWLDLRARWQPLRPTGVRRRGGLGPLQGLPAAFPGCGMGAVRLRQSGPGCAAARRSAGRDSSRDCADWLRHRPVALFLSPRLHDRLQLEGLHRQLPGGLSPSHGAPQPVSLIGLRAIPRGGASLLLVANRTHPGRQSTGAVLLAVSEFHAERVSGQLEQQPDSADGAGPDPDDFRMVRGFGRRREAGHHRLQR